MIPDKFPLPKAICFVYINSRTKNNCKLEEFEQYNAVQLNVVPGLVCIYTRSVSMCCSFRI